MPAKVDVEKCNACKECIDACPSQSIALENEKAKVDESLCTDCTLCVETCPSQAIAMF